MQKGPKIDEFLDNIKGIYKDKSTPVIQGLKSAKPTTFRINPTSLQSGPHLSIVELEKLGYIISRGDFPNTFYIKENKNKVYISDTEPFKTGQIYVQEFSSMIPPFILDPIPGEKILDMSAAPGSKTTQIAALANNEAEITAIEKHPLRILTLKHNLEMQNSKSVNVIHADGIRFDKKFPQYVEYFDKVLVDAPCSSEGRFNLNDKKSYKYWNIFKRKEMSKIQKGLLISGFRMLKKGGILLYSTCTFGVEENEMVLQWFLEKLGSEAKIEKIDMPLRSTFSGLTSYMGEKFDQSIRNSVRIIPNEFYTGFFMAKISKKK